jgi:hypothetical protein
MGLHQIGGNTWAREILNMALMSTLMWHYEQKQVLQERVDLLQERVDLFRERADLFRERVDLFRERADLFRERADLFRADLTGAKPC